MLRHFVAPEQLHQPRLELDRAAAHHLQGVLRVREGTEVELFDGCGNMVGGQVTRCGRGGLVIEHTGGPVAVPPPRCRLILCPCVGKGKRMDWLLEKAVELGASRIIPIISEHAVVRLGDAVDAGDKRERWHRIIIEAGRQCGAAWLPAIDTPAPFAEALPRLAAIRPLLVAALVPGALPLREVVTTQEPPAEAAFVTGPEGDFSGAELEALQGAGGLPVSLGRHVLRTETAAICGLAVLSIHWC